MNQKSSTNERHTDSSNQCLICGAHIGSERNETIDLICLICRAKILDRIFRARHQKPYR